MHTSEILTRINDEINLLQQVRSLLGGDGRGTHHPRTTLATAFPFGSNGTAPRKRRKMSAAGRARIVAAQKARWAKVKKAKVEKK
jgi:hypothetical protein